MEINHYLFLFGANFLSIQEDNLQCLLFRTQ